MSDNIYLTKMNRALAEAYFKEFVFDPAVFLDGQAVQMFQYTDEWLDEYLVRHKDCAHLAIMIQGRPIGEILFKRIDYIKRTAEFSIHLQNDFVKGKGYGTLAEILAIDYAFRQLGLSVLRADVIKKNSRSIHVLEKAGFRFVREDDYFYYYEIRNQEPVT